MTDSNVVSIIGRLTNNCEISTGSNGNTYGRFSIAVNRSYQVNGNWNDETSFFDCSMYGNLCTTKGPYLQKGKKVSVTGSLRQARWEKDGKKFNKVEIIVNQIQFLDSPASKKEEVKEVPQVAQVETTSATQEFYEEAFPF